MVKEPGVTEWSSPAVWVLKGDNVRVRLCTDYRELKKLVMRPVHPFPSTREILHAKDGCSTRILPASIRRRKLTTFLLPQGKFRYTRAPMGLNASSDEWCSRSDVVIEGLPWTRKMVDDILVWAETEDCLL